jgi:DNA-binding XRE family transcriptional regulator
MPNQPTAKHLAKLMRQWRKEQSLSVVDAAHVLALSPRTIEGIEQERGFNAPRVLEIALRSLITET